MQPPAKTRRRPWWRKPLLALASAVGPFLSSAALRGLGWTLRLRLLGAEDLFARWRRRERVIIAFWHDHLLVMPLLARGVPICILTSHHRDGEIATRALGGWGVQSVRGSATRGAVGGFLRLVHAFRRGYNLAVIPDGPRGPRHAAKPGVIHLARATGAPVFPVAYAASRAVRLGSWDRLMIPAPFARVAVVVGEPLFVASPCDGPEIEAHRRMLEQRLAEQYRVAKSRLAS